MIHTHYDNLRITRNATPRLIKAAYRALSQEFHPDRNPDRDTTRIMQIINDAYAVLGDPVARAKYDATITAQGATAGAAASAQNDRTQRSTQEAAERASRAADAAREQRQTNAAARKRQAEEDERKREAAEEVEHRRRAEAVAQQARERDAATGSPRVFLFIVLAFGFAVCVTYLALTWRFPANNQDVHGLSGMVVPTVDSEQARPESAILDRPATIHWEMGGRDSQHQSEVWYASEKASYDRTAVDVWLMRKFDSPVSSRANLPRYTYAIGPASINCAMRTYSTGDGAVFDSNWTMVSNYKAGPATALREASLDVQSTAARLCSIARG